MSYTSHSCILLHSFSGGYGCAGRMLCILLVDGLFLQPLQHPVVVAVAWRGPRPHLDICNDGMDLGGRQQLLID